MNVSSYFLNLISCNLIWNSYTMRMKVSEEKLILLVKLLSKSCFKNIKILANCFALKILHTLLNKVEVGYLENILIATIFCLLKYFSHRDFKSWKRLIDCSLAFILANICPSALDRRNCSPIDSISIRIRKFKNHFSCYVFSV